MAIEGVFAADASAGVYREWLVETEGHWHNILMPNRSRKKKPASPDPVQIARRIVDQATGVSMPSGPPKKKSAVKKRPAKKPEHKKDPAAVALGRKGGLVGGKARAATMTPEERAESARKAARARWAERPARQ
jgi:hypothetical protein